MRPCYLPPTLVIASLLVAPAAAAQSIVDLQSLQAPRQLALSADGARLHFTLGTEAWEIATAPGGKPARSSSGSAPGATDRPAVTGGSPRATAARRSPDAARIAFLDSPRPNAATSVYCCNGDGEPAAPRRISDRPIREWQWTADSKAFWVLFGDGADVALGRLRLDGSLDRVSDGAALRSGLAAANDVVAWVQSDPAHHGAIWIKDRSGRVFQLWDPNPQTTEWSKGWTQEVVRWKNAHGEQLQGVLARPGGRGPVPLVVDPYSSWQNRFLNIGLLGNYAFVNAGFAVFYPDHRAPFGFPAASFGDAYVGSSADRDPVDVLVDDVMSGVEELRRRGVIDGTRLFLYSFSTGASAIDQLLTGTTAFRAAVSFGGVADWLGYYRANQARGDETVPNFLGGRRPEDSPAVYDRISPARHAGSVRTPLRLVVGDQDSLAGGASRYRDTLAFYDALRAAGCPVELTVLPGQGHGINDSRLTEQHVSQAIEFFRAHMPPTGK